MKFKEVRFKKENKYEYQDGLLIKFVTHYIYCTEYYGHPPYLQPVEYGLVLVSDGKFGHLQLIPYDLIEFYMEDFA